MQRTSRIALALTFAVALIFSAATTSFAEEKRNRIGNSSPYIADVDYAFNICLQRCADTSVYRMALESCKSSCAEMRRKFPLRDKGYSSFESCAKAVDNFDLNRDLLEKRAADWCTRSSEHVHKRQGCREATAAFYGAVTLENTCIRGSSTKMVDRSPTPQGQSLSTPQVNQTPLTPAIPPVVPIAQPAPVKPVPAPTTPTAVSPSQPAPTGQGQIFPPMNVSANPPTQTAVPAPASQPPVQSHPVAVTTVTPNPAFTAPAGSYTSGANLPQRSLPTVNLPQTPVSSDTAVVLPAGQALSMPSYEKGISPFSYGNNNTFVMGQTLTDTPKYQTPEEVKRTTRRSSASQPAAKPKTVSTAAAPVKNTPPAVTAPVPTTPEKDAPMPEYIPPQQEPQVQPTSTQSPTIPTSTTPDDKASGQNLETPALVAAPAAKDNDIYEPVISMPAEPEITEPMASGPMVNEPSDPAYDPVVNTPVVSEPREVAEPVTLPVSPDVAEPQTPNVPETVIVVPTPIPDVQQTPPAGEQSTARAPLADILVIPQNQPVQVDDGSFNSPAPTPSMLKQPQPAPPTLKPGA